MSRHDEIRESYKQLGKIDSMLKQPNCPFVLYVGTKKLVKRREFEDYIRGKLVIKPPKCEKWS